MKRLIDVLATGLRDSAGAVLANGTVTFYNAGSTSLRTVYEDFDMTDPHPNPATLSEAGKLIAYSDYRLKLVISDSTGAVVETIDNVGTSDADVTVTVPSALAGNGLVTNDDGELDVNVDGTSLTIASDVISIATDGVTGAMVHSNVVDGTTIEQSGTQFRIKDSGVSTAKIADSAVTNAKRAAITQTTSTSCGSHSCTTGVYADVTNLSAAITCTGKPIRVELIGTGTAAVTRIVAFATAATTDFGMSLTVLRDATTIGEFPTQIQGASSAAWRVVIPGSSISTIDTPGVGTFTYKVQAKTLGTNSEGLLENIRLRVSEE